MHLAHLPGNPTSDVYCATQLLAESECHTIAVVSIVVVVRTVKVNVDKIVYVVIVGGGRPRPHSL
jgi:hypothetical protein